MGRYLGVMDWSVLFSSIDKCKDLINVFQKVISTGLDSVMPVSLIRVNSADAPWMTQDLKSVIMKAQSVPQKWW